MEKGIDISKWNGKIDFLQVKKSGVDFVIIREGYRKQIDPRFLEYVEESKKAGLVVLGIYHFLYTRSVEDAILEAQSAVSNAKKAGLNPDEIIIFSDYEYDTVDDAKEAGIVLTKEDCNAHVQAFCAEVTRLGYKAGIYTNLDYYRHYYTAETISPYSIWLADYTDGPDFSCIVQQYTSKGSVPGISGNVDMNYYYGDFKMDGEIKYSRQKVVDLALSWVGKNEKDGSYKEIIDIYNSFSGPFPRGVRMQYGWAWCACTWSALAVSLGYTEVMPIEISCGELINRAKEMGCWKENDGYIPSPGDGILYAWDDNGIGDNTDWPDHVGTVDYCNPNAGYMTVIEGNYSDSVKKRTISINGKYIRGFITPKYTDNSVVYESFGTSKDIATVAREVISGLWGDGDRRKEALERNGLNYAEVQTKVNEILNGPTNKKHSPTASLGGKVEATCYAKSKNSSLAGTYVTTADLYCRNDAGTNKKALCLIPKGTKVNNFGFYTTFNGVKWLLIQFTLNGVQYTGFSSSVYLKK